MQGVYAFQLFQGSDHRIGMILPEGGRKMTAKRSFCLFAALLAMTMLLGFAFAEEADPVVVRVGDITIRKSEIHAALETEINLTEVTEGIYLTDEEGRSPHWGQRLSRALGSPPPAGPPHPAGCRGSSGPPPKETGTCR